MTAALLNLTFDKGSSWSHTLILNQGKTKIPVNLSGYTAKMQIRQTVSATAVLLELSTENGRLVITPETGTITITVDTATTNTATFSTGVYDMEITSGGGETTRIVQGNITATAQVTR